MISTTMKHEIEKFILTILIPVFGLNSCVSCKKDENMARLNLVEEFGMDSTQLVYQYYQKYGFTDVCEDIRMVFRMHESPGLNERLPLDAEDLKRINHFSNKVDSIDGSSISFISNTRESFYDIELDFVEYSSDSFLKIQLGMGEYEIIQTEFSSTVKIFDSESGLFYLEVHRCDGR